MSLEDDLRGDVCDLMSENAELKSKIRDLEQWKESALKVMPDYQRIGKELGLTVGQSVHDKILPRVLEFKSCLENARGWIVANTNTPVHDLLRYIDFTLRKE